MVLPSGIECMYCRLKIHLAVNLILESTLFALFFILHFKLEGNFIQQVSEVHLGPINFKSYLTLRLLIVVKKELQYNVIRKIFFSFHYFYFCLHAFRYGTILHTKFELSIHQY